MTKAVLVFPPFVKPFCIPVGISYLKAYAEKHVKDVKIDCLDLNQTFHDIVLRHYESKPEAEDFVEAFKFFKENRNVNFDLEEAKKHHKNFLPVLNNIYAKYVSFFKEMLNGQRKMNNLIKRLGQIIVKQKPDVVGFSVNHDLQWHLALILGLILKQRNIKVVFGGSFFSTNPEKKFVPLMMDYLITGEGENSFTELIKAIKEKKELDNVPGLIYVKDNELKINAPKLIDNLDEIPFPDYSWLNPREYFTPKPVLPILTSRGCYWRKCAFCTHHKNFLGYRQRSIQRVIDELKFHKATGVSYFNFVDEMISASRFEQVAEGINEQGLDINYIGMAKPTKEFTYDIFKKMYNSGCRMMLWGVESGNQRVLDLINKGTNVEDIQKVLQDCARAGIKNHVFLIFGFPTENLEELKDTLNFVYNNKDVIHCVHKGPFALEAGSYIFEHPEEFGISQIHDADKLLNKYRYDVDSGLSCDEKEHYSLKYADFCESFSCLGNFIGSLREHALILYSERAEEINKLERNVHFLPK
ncbi:radical SAM protein [Candidatus Woesearchaeota archaeon]|nr:radical SAM protein [Candidatus Woesearchaeota archaeon]